MRVHIDRTVCQGTGYCVMLRDDVFAQDGDGVAILLTSPDSEQLEGLRDEMVETENLCPTGAITVVDT